MKKILLLWICCLSGIAVFSQSMTAKAYNFTTFTEDVRRVSPALEQHTSSQGKTHPEYGIRPFNSQCKECVELIDQRQEFSRQFIDPNRAGHTYSQESYFPLHYLDAQHVLRTIDYRLRPVQGHPGSFAAMHQPLPVRFDLAAHFTSIDLGIFEFKYNRGLSMYYATSTGNTASSTGDYGHYIIGDDGARVHDMWPHIDLEAFARKGEIETNFIISEKPALPAAEGTMMIEDHVRLPAGYSIRTQGVGVSAADHDLLVLDASGRTVAVMEHVRIRNNYNEAIITEYDLKQNGTDYTIGIRVPFSFLHVAADHYPIVVDPIVRGIDSLGNFKHSGRPRAGMNFTTLPGHCDYHMTVQVPGKSQLISGYVDVESETKSDLRCGDPTNTTGLGHVCLKREITHLVICDTCHVSEYLRCPAVTNCDTPGVLTTDPNLVPTAGPVPLLSNFVTCLPPQCPDYFLKFTLQNSDSSCGDVCGQLCAQGNEWRMLIEACRIDAYIDAVPTTVCAGQPVTLTCHPTCGVPPYHFMWSNGDSSGATITIHPQQDVIMGCIAYDACGNFALTNDTSIFVIQAPSADAGPDKRVCEGGAVTIGGNPTTTSGTATISWTATPASAQGRISDPSVSNPVITVPAGVLDTVLYEVKTDDQTCFRLDSMYVFSVPNPVAQIDTSGGTRICNGQSVTLNANGPFISYVWNDGGSGQSHTVTSTGQYYVIVTDSNQCKDTSNRISVTQIQVQAIHAYPDTLIFYGTTVGLYSDAVLTPPAVDSFFWAPDMFISCLRCPGPQVTPLADQTYVLTAYSQGCVLTDSARITVILPDKFYVPNAFTPNGDGVNDSFFIYAQSGVKLHTFLVFNRWGEKVHDGLYAWDGMYKGVLCTPGVYVYIMSVGLSGKTQDETLKGSVTLIR